jgi:hypothetical protein
MMKQIAFFMILLGASAADGGRRMGPAALP